MAYNLQGNDLYLQGSNPSFLQGSTSYLQGSSPTLFPTQPKQPIIKPTQQYGSSGATSPAKQQYINDLSSRYGQYDLNGNPTIYDKTTNTPFSNQQDFFKSAGVSSFDNLKFDTNYQPSQYPAQPASQPLQNSLGSTQPLQQQQPQADPMASFKSAYSDYLASLAPSAEYNSAKQKYLDFVSSAQSGINALEGQGRGIPLSLVRGQQAKLGNQAEIEAKRLQGDVSLAQENQSALQSQAKARADFENTLYQNSIESQRANKTDAQQTLANTATALLAQLNTLPDQATRDNYIRQKASELGLSIDEVNSALQKAQISEPIKLSEGDTLYDPKTGKPIFTAPKSYKSTGSGLGLGGGGGALSPLAQAVLNGTISLDKLTPTQRGQVAAELVNSGVQSSRQLSLSSNLEAVNALLKNPNIQRISGYLQGKLGLGDFLPSAQLALNQFNQIKGILSLENREKLKGSGAISDFEFKVLSEAASALDRNLSDSEFKSQLQKIRDVFAGKYAQTIPVGQANSGNITKVTNDPAGVR